MQTKTSFDSYYAMILKRALDAPQAYNNRTQQMVKAVDGVFLRLSSIPLLQLRDMKPLWTCAEAVWFMAGRSDTGFMHHFGFKNWDAFADNTGVVRSATGYRWRHHYTIDQLNEGLHKLRKDRSNRQAVLMSWDPYDDSTPGPNVPCLVTWHMHIIDGQLHMSVMQRSGDLYFGVPHDILGAWIIMEMCAASVQAKPGNLSYMVSNAHLYADQFDAAQQMIDRENEAEHKATYPPTLGITQDDTVRAMNSDKALVIELHQKILAMYKPFPPIAGPRLVK